MSDLLAHETQKLADLVNAHLDAVDVSLKNLQAELSFVHAYLEGEQEQVTGKTLALLERVSSLLGSAFPEDASS